MNMKNEQLAFPEMKNAAIGLKKSIDGNSKLDLITAKQMW